MALTDNLISYWKLDEASGTRSDSHGTNHLTDNNTVGSATGLVYGTAADFEMTASEYLSRANNTTLQCGDIDFTFAAWVKLESKGDNSIVIGKDNSTSGNREFNLLYRASTDRFALELFEATDSGTILHADTLGSPSTGVWYLVIGWYDAAANTMYIQVNNGAVDSTAKGTLQAAGAAGFRVGAREYSGAESYFDGLIGPAMLWKRVLTSDERTELWNGGAGLAYDDFGGGGTTENASPITATASVVTPVTSLTAAPSAIAATASLVGPTTSLVQAGTPITATYGVVSPTTALVQAGSPITAAGSVVTPTTSGDVVERPGAVSTAASVVTPTTALSGTVPPVTTAGGVVNPATALSQSPSPTTAAASVVPPTASLVQSAAPATLAAVVVAQTTTLVSTFSSISAAFSVVTPVDGRVETPGAVAVLVSVATLSTTLVASNTPATAVFTVVTPIATEPVAQQISGRTVACQVYVYDAAAEVYVPGAMQ